MEAFEHYLLTHLPRVESCHPHYEAALHQMLISGGKRFRPALILSVVEAYNPLLIPNAYPVALAIELLHTYSLIHDDLPAMDDAPLRRGTPTLHTTYDETTAILIGDALNTYAFEVLARAPLDPKSRVELIYTLAYHGGMSGMVLGQAIDCHFEHQRLELSEVITLHTLKTGRLIAGALKMGSIIVDRTDMAQMLYDFGIDLGLLFQIQDDILDVTLSSAEAGKTTHNDGDKNSFVTLLGLDGAREYANRLTATLEEQLDAFDPSLHATLYPLLAHYLYRHR